MPDPGEDSLFDEAVDIAIRLQAGPDDPGINDLARRWRGRSPAHARVWAEVIEIHGLAGAVLAPPEPPRGGMARRALLLGGVAGLGALTAPGLIRAARADHLTGAGETEDFALAFGGRATLGPDSAVALLPAESGLRLLSGMVYCAAGQGELSLSAGDLSLTLGAGGALGLSREGPVVTIEVETGAARIGGMRIGAGEWLRLDGESERRGALDQGRAAPWRAGLLIAQAESVGVLAGRIGRWLPGRVVVASPWLAAREVSGVYDLTRPLDALRAVVLPWSGHVRQASPWLTILSTV